jgi:hypothetical protein
MNARYTESNTAESEEGTAAHWVMSQLLAGPQVAEDTLSPNGVTVTGEMIEGAELVRDVVRERIPTLGWGLLHVEETLNIPAIHPDCFGTPDVWAYDEAARNLEIVDYKFGHRFVDEYFNAQGLLYMLGIIGTLPSIPTSVSFTIVQPRCFYRGEPVRTHTYYINHATPYLSAIREAAERAYHAQPTATTGAHCEHCPGRHTCPTLQKAAYSDAETSTDQQPVKLTPQAAALELRMLERALLRLTARVEGLRESTAANLRAGAQVPYYKLEAARGRRKWIVSPEELLKVAKPKQKKQLTLLKIITPKQAELYLDNEIITRYSDVIPGALKLVESTDTDAARVFKKETYVTTSEPVNPSRPPGHGEPV